MKKRITGNPHTTANLRWFSQFFLGLGTTALWTALVIFCWRLQNVDEIGTFQVWFVLGVIFGTIAVWGLLARKYWVGVFGSYVAVSLILATPIFMSFDNIYQPLLITALVGLLLAGISHLAHNFVMNQQHDFISSKLSALAPEDLAEDEESTQDNPSSSEMKNIHRYDR